MNYISSKKWMHLRLVLGFQLLFLFFFLDLIEPVVILLFYLQHILLHNYLIRGHFSLHEILVEFLETNRRVPIYIHIFHQHQLQTRELFVILFKNSAQLLL